MQAVKHPLHIPPCPLVFSEFSFPALSALLVPFLRTPTEPVPSALILVCCCTSIRKTFFALFPELPLLRRSTVATTVFCLISRRISSCFQLDPRVMFFYAPYTVNCYFFFYKQACFFFAVGISRLNWRPVLAHVTASVPPVLCPPIFTVLWFWVFLLSATFAACCVVLLAAEVNRPPLPAIPRLLFFFTF